jgi:hypothetical protein
MREYKVDTRRGSPTDRQTCRPVGGVITRESAAIYKHGRRSYHCAILAEGERNEKEKIREDATV